MPARWPACRVTGPPWAGSSRTAPPRPGSRGRTGARRSARRPAGARRGSSPAGRPRRPRRSRLRPGASRRRPSSKSRFTALAVLSCSRVPSGSSSERRSPVAVRRSALQLAMGICRQASQPAGARAPRVSRRLRLLRRARSGRSRLARARAPGSWAKRWRNAWAFCQACSWSLLRARQRCSSAWSASRAPPDSSRVSQCAASRATWRAGAMAGRSQLHQQACS